MPKRFDLLIFDWDGTLIDSAAVIASAIQYAARDAQLPIPSEEAARHVIGLGLAEALAYLFPNADTTRLDALVAQYRHHFLAKDADIPLFDGVKQGIPKLKESGFLLAIATGKSRVGLERSLKNTGLAEYFDGSRCADECRSKPHPKMILELTEQLGVEPSRTLMIGDTSHDMQMANNAGVACLAVAYGAHAEQHLTACSPLGCLNSFEALLQWLQTHA